MAKKKKNPARILMTLVVLIVVGLGTLVGGVVTKNTSYVPELALDLQGGTQLILTPTPREGEESVEISDTDLQQAIQIIRQRVDASGVAEAEITSQGGRNIVVSLPGNPTEETLNLVRSSAVMRMRPVLVAADFRMMEAINPPAVSGGSDTSDPEQSAEDSATQPPEPSDTATDASESTADEQPTVKGIPQEQAQELADQNGDGEISAEREQEPSDASDLAWITEQMYLDFLMLDCSDPESHGKGSADDPEIPLVTCKTDGTEKYILGPSELEGTELESATAGMERNNQGQSTGKWMVYLQFNDEGSQQFYEISERLFGFHTEDPTRNRFAAVLDGNVIVAPSMEAVIPDGSASISGSFTPESARSLANQLQFGSLPLNFTVESERRISATLGADHLEIGLWTGVIGLALVVLYLIWQYHGLAVLAAGSLGVAAIIVYIAIALLSWLMGYRLSLAGVAGLIIAVGITADSFIVYFERIRDEVREGRSLVDAVNHGWERARRTIIVSDMVNLLAAIVLYFLAVGGVQGFAFTLGLTTVVDLAVILMFTHPMLELLIRTEFFGQGHRWSGLDPEHLGASSRAVYAGRGVVRAPKQRRKQGKQDASQAVPDMGRTSIAQRRREAQLREKDKENQQAEIDGDTAAEANFAETVIEVDRSTTDTTGEEPSK
ncbi:MAG: protein translocase subunit SecD [Actinomycetaceae bacterium]|nr:protein translocase subunit SecD [Actinomycetaceae bacterium]